jgi:hypothetical protein
MSYPGAHRRAPDGAIRIRKRMEAISTTSILPIW